MSDQLHEGARPSANYRPELDGLRAIAITFVLLFHCLAVPASGSTVWLHRAVSVMWSGVDIFFVLSGFLITGILLDTRNEPNRWMNFIARRTLRVFPLYYLWLVIVFWVLPRFLETSLSPPNAEPWCWTYTFNCYIWVKNTFPEPVTINHFWSLAVEEQFYLVWPIIVFALPSRLIGTVCLLGICSSIALKTYLYFGSSIHGMALYTATPLRADALLGGGFVAWLIRHPSAAKTKSVYRLIVVAGVLALLLLFRLRGFQNLVTFDKFTVCFLTSFFALTVPTLLQVLIENPNSVLVRVLSWKGFRPIAKISYGLYISHYIVFILLVTSHKSQMVRVASQFGIPAWVVLFVFTVLISGIISTVLYLLVERPVLKLKRHFPYRQSST